MPDTETPQLTVPAARENSANQRRDPAYEAALGARIRAARVAARMSQTELGRAIGISFQQVQKYESGKDRVAVSTLHGIATALGIHPGSFFDVDTPEPERNVMDIRASMKIGERIQRVRDPSVVRRLLALVDLLAGASAEEAEKPANRASARKAEP